MKRSQFIKISGWSLMLGALILVLACLNGSIAGFVISSILLAVGMLGLRARYGEAVGTTGSALLLIGAIGSAVTFIGVPTAKAVEAMYLLPFAGPAVILLCLALFGITALRRRPLPYLNWLPLAAGIWYPAIYFSVFFAILLNNGDWPENDLPWTLIQMILLIQLVALWALGLILQDKVPQQEQVPA